jgi:YcaO-like protein with predicted kinase domain
VRWRLRQYGHIFLRYSDRTLRAEETLSNVTPWLSRFGITRLARLTNLDCLNIPVWNAVAPNSRSIVINQGKGLTDIDAKVSAAMEAIERAVAGSPFTKSFNDTAENLTASGQTALLLPGLIAPSQPDLPPEEPTEWLSGYDLLAEREVFVPKAAMLLDRTVRENRFWQTSDGLASGNTFEEAAFHGLLERIERDAELLWRVGSFEKRSARCVNPGSYGDDKLDDLVDKIERAGLALRLFDITSDTSIPCFTAYLAPADILAMRKPKFIDVTSGHGCHPSPIRAAIRAITEAAQSRLTYISGARDDVYPETFTRSLTEDIRQQFSIRPAPAPKLPEQPTGTLSAMLANTLEKLKMVGIGSAVAVRLSNNEMPFSVVRMIVEGLENPDGLRKRRFGPRALSHALAAI